MGWHKWAPLKPIMGPNVAVSPPEFLEIPENAQRNEQSETLSLP